MLAERLLDSQKAASDTEANDRRLPVGDEDSLESMDAGRRVRLDGEKGARHLVGDAAGSCLSGELTSKLDSMSIFFSKVAFASSRPSASLTWVRMLSSSHSNSAILASLISTSSSNACNRNFISTSESAYRNLSF